jgi:hypothetical protein
MPWARHRQTNGAPLVCPRHAAGNRRQSAARRRRALGRAPRAELVNGSPAPAPRCRWCGLVHFRHELGGPGWVVRYPPAKGHRLGMRQTLTPRGAEFGSTMESAGRSSTTGETTTPARARRAPQRRTGRTCRRSSFASRRAVRSRYRNPLSQKKPLTIGQRSGFCPALHDPPN